MIKAPRWIKNPKATTRGWVNARTGELLKSKKISQADCDEFNGVKAAPAPVKPEPVVEPVDHAVIRADALSELAELDAPLLFSDDELEDL